jgi:hypothetical protein
MRGLLKDFQPLQNSLSYWGGRINPLHSFETRHHVPAAGKLEAM